MSYATERRVTIADVLIALITLGLVGATLIARRSDASADTPVSEMRTTMRNLHAAETAYYLDHRGRFADNTAALGVLFTAAPGITVTISGVTDRHWHARVTHQSSPLRCDLDIVLEARGDVDADCR